MIGIFGSAPGNLTGETWRGQSGATVAATEWIRAVVASGCEADGYELFDRHGLVPPGSEQSLIDLRQGTLLTPLSMLPEALRHRRHRAYHCPYGAELSKAIPVVRRLCAEPTPVTAIQYTAGVPVAAREWMLTHLAGCRPYDCLICPSNAALNAQSVLMEHARERIARATGSTADSISGPTLRRIPLGVDAVAFCPGEPGAAMALRRQLGISDDAFVFLVTGRLTPASKADLSVLIRAFRLVEEAYSRPLALVVAGIDDSNYARGVELLIREMGLGTSCTVLRNVPGYALPLVYQASNAFIAPSDSIAETFGLTVLEAMASGLPVIASDWDGFRDLVRSNHTGELVPTAWSVGALDDRLTELEVDEGLEQFRLAQSVVVDRDAMARAMLGLAEHPQRAKQFGENARALVVRDYTWHSIARQYHDLWDELCLLARACPSQEPLGDRLIPYERAFGAYATERVRLVDQLIVSRVDLATVPIQITAAHIEAHGRVLRLDRLSAIVEKSRSPIRVSTIGTDAESVRHVAWLLKHGYVQRITGSSSGEG